MYSGKNIISFLTLRRFIPFVLILLLISCESSKPEKAEQIVINREAYSDQLYGFWLGTCIANWTGLITEMDKIGNIGEIKTGDFYTSSNWGGPDEPNIWSVDSVSSLSPIIDFVFASPDSIWGADDDTDIEYIYQELLLDSESPILSGEEIREGWLKHIHKEEENYLWVSNQKAFDLMNQGLSPPQTGDPENNPEFEMIDAQLTTEIFGLYAPGRPDIALEMAALPIQNVARLESEWISNFYVSMFSLASTVDISFSRGNQLKDIAEKSSHLLPDSSYSQKMYQFVRKMYEEGYSWEETRDSVYHRYQVLEMDGYDLTSKGIYCNACFAAGINFAASLVSLFYGEGDLKETIKIGALCGWDSDNPTATWGGLIGFMIGKEGIDKAFGRQFSNRYNIHRTRKNFANNGIDNFQNMADKGIQIIDRVVIELIDGKVDTLENTWVIPHLNRQHGNK